MVLGVLGEDFLVSRPRLLHVAVARVERGHHVEEARTTLGRNEVDGAADLVKRLARTARPRPRIAESDEYLGIPDVAVDVRELPEHVAAIPVLDNGLERLLDVVLAARCLGMVGARHLELVEERADIVPVDGIENELVHIERAVVVTGVLKPDAAVVRHETNMATKTKARELDWIVLLPKPVAAPVLDTLRRRENLVELIPRAPVGLAIRICAEEEELGHRLYPGGVPEVWGAEYCGLLRDVGICRKPVLDERKHAERERNRKLAVLVAADPLLLYEFREFAEIALVEVALQAHEIEFLARLRRLRGGESQVVVEKTVGDEPSAVSKVSNQLLGRAVCKVAARAIKREDVQKDSDAHDERQHWENGEGERAALHRHRLGFKRLVLADLRDGEQPPVSHEIGGRERRKRAGHDGKEPVGAHKRRGRERSGDGENCHEAHRNVVYPLGKTALAVVGDKAREERHDKRQHRKGADEEPAIRGEPHLRFVPVGAHVLGEVAGGVGSVDEERDNRNEEKHERRAIRLAAALPRDRPHTTKVAEGEKPEERRVREPEPRENADEDRIDPASILAGAGVWNQQRRRHERPCGVERERAKVHERLVDGGRRHEYY